MELRTEWLEIPAGAAVQRAYLARPAGAAPCPGLLVLQEMWGVDEHIMDVTRRYAEAGYAALAPDLFSAGGSRPPALAPERIEAFKRFVDSAGPGVWGNAEALQAALARLPAAEAAQVGQTQQALFSGPMRQTAQHVEGLRAAAAWLGAQGWCAGQPLGCVGYCMGGGLAAQLAASDAGMRAAVIYYGASLPAERVPAVGCPILGIYGGDDHRITDTVPAFATAMAAEGKAFEPRIYPGAPHAFFNDGRPSYRAAPARDAWARTLSFLAQHLA